MRPATALFAFVVLAASCFGRPLVAAEDPVRLWGYGSAAEWQHLRTGFRADSGRNVEGTPSSPTEVLEQLGKAGSGLVVDCLLLPGASALLAEREGRFTPYNPVGLSAIPAGYRDRKNRWFAAYSATITLLIREQVLATAAVPGSWLDLTREPFRGKVAYEDPRGGGSGYTFLFGINQLLGGSAEDFEPGLGFLDSLHQNGARALDRSSAEAALEKGEIGIWIGLDAEGYRLREAGAPIRILIPREGTFQHLTVAGMAAGAPRPDAAHAFLDWLVKPTTQTHLARAYLQPVLLSATPAEIARTKLPPRQYARARALPLPQMADAFEALTTAWEERFGDR